jgi:hypothetical protein
MTKGAILYNGLALPAFGEATMTQVTAATDILSLKGVTGQSGDFLVMMDYNESEVFSFHENGIFHIAPIAKPTTGVDIGDIFMFRTGTAYRLGIVVTGTTCKYAKFSLTIGG